MDIYVPESAYDNEHNGVILYIHGGSWTGGYVVDESWFENDGLVNTVSAKAPSHAPSAEFDAENITAGVWNIMPVYLGDHMSLQGGFFKVNTDVVRLYTEHFDMINQL